MLSKAAVFMFIGQIILAFLLFYFLPKSEGYSDGESLKKVSKKGRPIISLKNGITRLHVKKTV